MKKPVYKLLDEKGRILIPKEFRQMAELESGDIVKLVKHMSPAKQVALAARILKFAQQEGGTDC